jgi:penicillin-binding protein 1A
MIVTRQTRDESTPHWAVWVRRTAWTMNALALICACAGGSFVAGALSRLQANLPSAEELVDYRPRLTTEIYSTEIQADGRETHTLLARLFRENREWASLDEMPLHLIHATVAVEDRPFFRHRGIDPKGIIRAALANLRAGEIRQGGSTITQQLVRAVWLSQERTVTRKLKEILLALQVERNFTKEELLEMYLNEVCYGHGAYGVKAASELYFGKKPNELTLAECALLAGMPRWPAGYSPFEHPDRAKRRRAQVLHAMVEMGYITPAEAAAASQEPLIPEGREPREVGFAAFRAPHFTHMVVRKLCEAYGVSAIYEGGLRIYTTLDMRLQKAAEEELTRHIESLRRNGNLRKDLVGQGALVCMSVKDGDVLAMVGGVGPYEKVQYNRCAPGPPYYGRQAGSAFKPYVWTAALEHGYGPNSVVSGGPIAIPVGEGRYWTPRGGSGAYTLDAALRHSINRVSVRLLLAVGADKVAEKAALMMGIARTRLRAVPSLALGTSEVSPLEMAVGFSCFANGGYRVEPRFVRRITDEMGRVIVEVPEQRTRVIAAEIAKSMVDMMKGVIRSGTGTRARIPGPCAGKTGTAQDARDVWFVGFTPTLCTAIWIGNDDHTPIRGGAYGGTLCAPVWAKFMRRAIRIRPSTEDFPTGEGVRSRIAEVRKEERSRTATLCRESNGLATPYCPSTYEKVFAAGEELPGMCTLHGPGGAASVEASEVRQRGSGSADASSATEGARRVTVCVDSGQLATPYCPNTVERSFPLGGGPSGRCTIHGQAGTPKAAESGATPPGTQAKPETSSGKPLQEKPDVGVSTGAGDGGTPAGPQASANVEHSPAATEHE